MKLIASGRRLDELGRVVLPQVGRKTLGLDEASPVDVFLDDGEEYLIIKKSVPSCVCCGSTEQLKPLPNGKQLCQQCYHAAG